MSRAKASATDLPVGAPRRIVRRTRGRQQGAIVRLVSPDGLGRLLKPFVFLDLFEIQADAFAGGELHPHSGIATVTYVLEGAVRYENTAGDRGVLGAGAVEWFKAGHGAWHGGGPVGAGVTRGFQLWLALPPDQELGEAETIVVPPESVPREGPARVLLGVQGAAVSPIPPPGSLNYLAVGLRAGEVWRYRPASDHASTWLAVASGSLGTPEPVAAGELVVFEPGPTPISIHANTDTEFVIGSAAPHPHDLAVGYNSVHTSPASLAAGEHRIAEVARQLQADGRLPEVQA